MKTNRASGSTATRVRAERRRHMIQMAYLTTTAPLLLVVSGVPLLSVEPLAPEFPLLSFPPSDGVHEPPGRPTQLFGW